jgi:hypothetical protein
MNSPYLESDLHTRFDAHVAVWSVPPFWVTVNDTVGTVDEITDVRALSARMLWVGVSHSRSTTAILRICP